MTGQDRRFNIYLSPREREKFGVITARAEDIARENLDEVYAFCRREKVKLLIARCRTTELEAAQALEQNGALLVDTLIIYLRNLVRTPIPEVSGHSIIREIRPGEEDAVRTVAKAAFQGYEGHYGADKRLRMIDSGEIYSSWAYRFSRDRDETHGTIVAEKGGEIVGFGLVRIDRSGDAAGILEGVSPREGKRSLVQRDMAIGAMNWARERGAVRFLATVALTNIVMQKIIIRLGYEPCGSCYTFHRWFENSQVE
jgi:hypothetical protein